MTQLIVEIRTQPPLDVEVDRIPQSAPRKAIVGLRGFIVEGDDEIDVILRNLSAWTVQYKAQTIDLDDVYADKAAGRAKSFYTFVLSGSLIRPQPDYRNLLLENTNSVKLFGHRSWPVGRASHIRIPLNSHSKISTELPSATPPVEAEAFVR
ncbi:MAG: hypothetical protein QM608_08150 [Caulobacter sp.]